MFIKKLKLILSLILTCLALGGGITLLTVRAEKESEETNEDDGNKFKMPDINIPQIDYKSYGNQLKTEVDDFLYVWRRQGIPGYYDGMVYFPYKPYLNDILLMAWQDVLEYHNSTESPLRQVSGGDNSTIESSFVPTASSLTNREEVDFERVVDGDTIIVSKGGNEYYVRLIGINAPEYSRYNNEVNSSEGKKAKKFLTDLLSNTTALYLEYDIDKTDDYERILAYVWLSNTSLSIEEDMLNAIILKNGHAEVETVYPNVLYEDSLNIIANIKKDAS